MPCALHHRLLMSALTLLEPPLHHRATPDASQSVLATSRPQCRTHIPAPRLPPICVSSFLCVAASMAGAAVSYERADLRASRTAVSFPRAGDGGLTTYHSIGFGLQSSVLGCASTTRTWFLNEVCFYLVLDETRFVVCSCCTQAQEEMCLSITFGSFQIIWNHRRFFLRWNHRRCTISFIYF
jgi:hypothetical protein